MSQSNDSDRVRRLLERVDQQRQPNPEERDKIEQQMWAALDQVEARRDRADLHMRRRGHRPGQESDQPRPTRRSRALFLAAAAVLVLVAIPVGVRLFDGEAAAPELASGDPAVRFTATVGGVPLSFSTTEPASLGESGADFLAVRATNARNPFDTSTNSVTGQVIIARPTLIFDGEDPGAWFAKHEIQTQPVVATHLGEPIPAWNLVLPEGSVADRGCDAGSPCLEFAEMASGRSLSLEQGFELNRVRLIPVDGSDQPILVFSLFSGPRQGPSDDPVAKLSGEVLLTLRFGECPLAC